MIGAIFVLLLLVNINLEEVMQASKLVDVRVLILLCMIQLATIGLVNWQWTSLGILLSKKVSYLQMFSIQVMATCIECITPSAKFGGEATRGMMFKSKYQIPYHESTALMVTQKFFSMLSFTILCLVSMLYLLMTSSGGLLSFLLPIAFLLVVIFLLFVFLILFPNTIVVIVNFFHFRVFKIYKVITFIEKFNDQLIRAMKNKTFFIKQFSISLTIWMIYPIKAFILSHSMGIPLNFLTLAAISFIAYSVAMVPLTPGSIGTFEASVVLLLTRYTVNSSDAMIFAIALRFVTFWFVFLFSLTYGSVVFLGKRVLFNRTVIKTNN